MVQFTNETPQRAQQCPLIRPVSAGCTRDPGAKPNVMACWPGHPWEHPPTGAKPGQAPEATGLVPGPDTDDERGATTPRLG